MEEGGQIKVIRGIAVIIFYVDKFLSIFYNGIREFIGDMLSFLNDYSVVVSGVFSLIVAVPSFIYARTANRNSENAIKTAKEANEYQMLIAANSVSEKYREIISDLDRKLDNVVRVMNSASSEAHIKLVQCFWRLENYQSSYQEIGGGDTLDNLFDRSAEKVKDLLCKNSAEHGQYGNTFEVVGWVLDVLRDGKCASLELSVVNDIQTLSKYALKNDLEKLLGDASEVMIKLSQKYAEVECDVESGIELAEQFIFKYKNEGIEPYGNLLSKIESYRDALRLFSGLRHNLDERSYLESNRVGLFKKDQLALTYKYAIINLLVGDWRAVNYVAKGEGSIFEYYNQEEIAERKTTKLTREILSILN